MMCLSICVQMLLCQCVHMFQPLIISKSESLSVHSSLHKTWVLCPLQSKNSQNMPDKLCSTYYLSSKYNHIWGWQSITTDLILIEQLLTHGRVLGMNWQLVSVRTKLKQDLPWLVVIITFLQRKCILSCVTCKHNDCIHCWPVYLSMCMSGGWLELWNFLENL